MKKVNSFESTQSALSLNNNDFIEQNNSMFYGIQSSIVNNKPKRPVLCLFSANKHRQHLQQEKYYFKYPKLIQDDNSLSQNINVQHSLKSINLSTSQLPVINYTKRIIRSSSNNINMNSNKVENNKNLLCNTIECKSCMNLQAYNLVQDRYRNPSSGSTVSQIPRSDLPDVYLNVGYL
ncbi:unnamed protein product [Heterobilharzia americana]|nr:unnamed protein product [Heterobilharzia americana]